MPTTTTPLRGGICRAYGVEGQEWTREAQWHCRNRRVLRECQRGCVCTVVLTNGHLVVGPDVATDHNM